MIRPAIRLLLLGWACGAATWQEAYKFDVSVRTVSIDVFVTRDGEPVTGLIAEDFEVLDNGLPQQIGLLQFGRVPVSALLILDTSSSLVGEKFSHLRSAAHAFLAGLGENDRAGLLTFSHELRLQRAPTQDIDSLHRALDEVVTGGVTAMVDALYSGLKLLEDTEGRPLVLLFTDGLDNISWIGDEEILEVVRESEALIYVVGIESPRWSGPSGWVMTAQGELRMGSPTLTQETPDPTRLPRRIAEFSGGRFISAESSARLKDAFLTIHSEMTTRYLLSYSPSGALQPGWHRLQVKVKKPNVDLRARPGYHVPPVQ